MSAQWPDPGDGPMIEILLATYNGAEFVAEQLNSLLRQTYRNWRVLARDDGSGDGTVEILRDYADRHPDRFVLLDNEDGNLGYVGNFSRLMERSTAEYLAFCDQDDVWRAEKLAHSIEMLQQLEDRHGRSAPLLAHSDLEVVDRDLKPIGPSFWHYRGIDARRGDSLNRLLTQNVATGCTVLFNRPLRDLSLPVPPQAVAHDWWVALVAGAFGRIDCIADPTVLYRQHGDNTTGARSFQPRHLLRRLGDVAGDFAGYRREFDCAYRQARVFLDRYETLLTAEQRTLLTEFAAFPGLNPVMLGYLAIKWKVVPIRRLYWLIFALLISVLPSEAPAES